MEICQPVIHGILVPSTTFNRPNSANISAKKFSCTVPDFHGFKYILGVLKDELLTEPKSLSIRSTNSAVGSASWSIFLSVKFRYTESVVWKK